MPYLNRMATITVPVTRYVYAINQNDVSHESAFDLPDRTITFIHPDDATGTDVELFEKVTKIHIPTDRNGNDPAAYLAEGLPYNLQFNFVYVPYSSIGVRMIYRVTAIARELEFSILTVTFVSRTQVPASQLGDLTRDELWTFSNWLITDLVRVGVDRTKYDIWCRIISDSDSLSLFLTGTDSTDPASQESLTLYCRYDDRIKPGYQVSIEGNPTNYIVATITVEDDRFMNLGLIGR